MLFRSNSAIFAFVLKSRQLVSIKILTTSGQLVATLIDEELNTGEHLVRLNATDLSPGIYFYQFIVADRFQAGALIIHK